MLEVCKYLDVARVGQETPGSLLVERCGDKYGELSDFEIRVTESNLESVLVWVRENIVVSEEHLMQMYEKDWCSIMKVILSMKLAGSYTDEFIQDIGSVQGFLDKYGRGASDEELPEGIIEPEDFTSEDTTNTVDTAEVLDTDDSYGVTELKGDSASLDEVESLQEDEEELFNKFREQIDIDADVLEDLESSADKFRTNTADNGNERAVEVATSSGDTFAVPLDKLPEIAESIIDAAKNLEESDFKPEYALTIEELQDAVDIVNDISPTLCKQFLLEYVRTAKTSKERLRVSSLLDQFVTYVYKATGGESLEKSR